MEAKWLFGSPRGSEEERAIGNYIVSVVNIDKREKISIERLGEYQKWRYEFARYENSLLPAMVTWLTVFRNQIGREGETSQGRWVGDRVMFCGDAIEVEGDEPGWQIGEIFTEARRYEDITPKILADICEVNPPIVELLAGRCLAILRDDPQVDRRMSDDFRRLVFDAILTERGDWLEKNLKQQMGDGLEAFLKDPEKV